MKKILLSITLVLAVLICLASCNKEETPQIDNSTAPNTQQTTPNSQETTPKTEVTTPKTEETTPDSQETTGEATKRFPKPFGKHCKSFRKSNIAKSNCIFKPLRVISNLP